MAEKNLSRSIESSIYLIRDQKVILDEDLALLYDVETRSLIQAVKRNLDRFPADFMFRLSDQEFGNLRSQIVISSWGGRRIPPYAFTEQGVAMLSSVLKSKRAVQVNIEIMRTFVRLRDTINSQQDLSHRISSLERRYDHQFKVVFDAIREIMTPKQPPQKRQIGFRTNDEKT